MGLAEAVTAGVAESSRSVDATGRSLVEVPVGSWRGVGEAIAAAGGQLDWLTGVDMGAVDGAGAIQVVAMFIRGEDSVLVRTQVGYSEPLPTVSDLFSAAAWHERETAEMLGVAIVGGDPRRLLLPQEFEGHPLRRDFPLSARLQTPWPGAEPGRRARVPGINPEWQQ